MNKRSNNVSRFLRLFGQCILLILITFVLVSCYQSRPALTPAPQLQMMPTIVYEDVQWVTSDNTRQVTYLPSQFYEDKTLIILKYIDEEFPYALTVAGFSCTST